MLQTYRLAAVVTLLTLVSSLAQAAPIAYVESVDGDLPDTGTPLPDVHFDVGLNTVSGNTGYDANTDSDLDSFAFVIPTGFSMISGSVLLTDAQGNLTTARWELHSGSSNWLTGTFVEQLDSDSPGSATISALSAGTYNMSATSLTANLPVPANANYVFSFNIVPEPTTLGILALTPFALLNAAVAEHNSFASTNEHEETRIQFTLLSSCPSVIHQSSFIIHHLSFLAHRSSLIAHRSSLIAHRSSLIAHRSSLIAHRSSLFAPSRNSTRIRLSQSRSAGELPHLRIAHLPIRRAWHFQSQYKHHIHRIVQPHRHRRLPIPRLRHLQRQPHILNPLHRSRQGHHDLIKLRPMRHQRNHHRLHLVAEWSARCTPGLFVCGMAQSPA